MEYTVGAAFFILGVIVGSFLNVVVLRFGFRERDTVRSHCASCGATLAPLDLVPILSYVALGGRCRHCKSRVSAQYPVVEALTGVMFVTTYLTLRPDAVVLDGLMLLAYLGFWSVLIALVVYDIRHTLIPLPLVYWLVAFAVFGALVRALDALSMVPLGDALLGALVGGGFFALIHFVTRGRGMGLGDAYIAALIGCMLGLSSGVVALTLGVWIGAIVGVTTLIVAHFFPRVRLGVAGSQVTLKSEIPFAPFLALGAVIAFVTHLSPLAFGLWGIPY